MLTNDNSLATQIHAFNSFLAIASDPHPRESRGSTPISPVSESISAARMILETVSLQKQLAEAENQLRAIRKLLLAGGIDGIDDRIQCLDDFANQLLQLQQHRNQFVDKLNRPRVGEHIVMDHQYHKDFVRLFQRIQEQVPMLQQNLDAIAWKDGFLCSTRELEQMKACLGELTELTQRQTEIADASQRLQASLANVLQCSEKQKFTP
ncbi:hypothetical protein BGX34_002071 [Mortierella sp. NVP85]|nr:hypothetical protein BGX34_002071 [Mortierella sp. NVP85]